MISTYVATLLIYQIPSLFPFTSHCKTFIHRLITFIYKWDEFLIKFLFFSPSFSEDRKMFFPSLPDLLMYFYVFSFLWLWEITGSFLYAIFLFTRIFIVLLWSWELFHKFWFILLQISLFDCLRQKFLLIFKTRSKLFHKSFTLLETLNPVTAHRVRCVRNVRDTLKPEV